MTNASGLPALARAITCFFSLGFAFVITAKAQADATALVRHAPQINGRVEGDIHMMSGEWMNVNSGAVITGDLQVPGTPNVNQNGSPNIGSIVNSTGNASPTNYGITVNSGATVGRILRRVNPVSLPSVSAPPNPAGNRYVNLNNASESPGNFATIRNLNLNSNVGNVAVPAGTYGDFSANSGSGFVLGVAGATEPAIYHFQRLNLNSNSVLQVAGPVIVTVKNSLNLNALSGNAAAPGWLTFRISSGGLNDNSPAVLYGFIEAPNGTVNINGRVVGGVIADRLTVNSGGVLELREAAAPNTLPVAQNLAVSTPEDTAVAVTLSATDADGDALTYTISSGPAHGTLSGVAPTLTYTPATSFNGTDAFTFTAADGEGSSNVATVSLTVTPVNDAPTAADISATLDEDDSVALTLSGADIDGDTLTFTVTEAPSFGVLTGSGAALTYAPNPDFNGSDSFTYRTSDGSLDSALATVSLQVNPINDAPVASGQSLTVNEGETLAFTLAATDVDADPLSFEIVATAAHGVVSGTAPNLSYVPAANFGGADALTFRAFDGVADSNVATIAIAVTNLNDPPVVMDQAASTPEDTAVSLILTGNDPDGDSLTFTVLGGPTSGVIAQTGATVTYTPNLNFFGTDTFTFTANDGEFDAAPGTFTIGVTPVNDAPIADVQTVTTAEDTSVVITLSANDVEGDALSFVIDTPPTHGVLSGSGATLTYTPTANVHGTDAFTFHANDGTADSAVVTVDLTVTPVNDLPTVADATFELAEDTSVEITFITTDIEGDTLTIEVTTPPAHGTLSGDPFAPTYTPDANYFGSDEFVVQVSDGTTTSATALITLTVTPVNDAPVVPAQTINATEDTIATFTLSASDLEGDALSFTITTAPVHGTLSVSPDGIFTYFPSVDFNGTDAFEVIANDGDLDSAPATIELIVAPVNDAPVADSQSRTTAEDTAVTITLTATDVDGDVLSYSIATAPTNGVLSGSAPNLTYTPNPNFNGSDSFTFYASDAALDSPTVTVSLTVTPVNDAPIAASQSVTTLEDSPLIVTLTGADIDGDALSFTIIDAPANGVLSGTGANVTYTPTANFAGTDSFTFVANDGTVDSSPATITIDVTPVNDVPTVAEATIELAEDTSVEITFNTTDVEGDALTIEVTTPPAHGTLSGDPFAPTYTPAADYFGSDEFVVEVSDGTATSATALIALTITPVNDAPIVPAQAINVTEDTTAIFTLSVSDIEDDALTFAITAAPIHGTLTIALDGTFTYIPEADFNGADAFEVVANDGDLDSAPATIDLVVAPVNDAPIAADVAITTDRSVAVTVTLSGTDIEGDPLTFDVVTPPAHGTLTGAGSTLVYTPVSSFSGADSFTYVANDGTDNSAAAVVSITVLATNRAPTAEAVDVGVNEDTPTTILLAGLDPDGDPLTYTVLAAPIHGSLSGNGPEVIYTPDLNYFGVDSFSYDVSDGSLTSAAADVTITVVSVNDLPVALDQSLTTEEDTALTIELEGTDVDDITLTYAIASAPSLGTLTGVPPAVTYTPDVNLFGTDSFTFTVADGEASSTATISITVTPVNDAPVALAASYVATTGTPVEITLDGTDVEGDALTFDVVTGPIHGVLTGTAPNLSYTSSPDFGGFDSFTFVANDGALDSAPTTIQITSGLPPRSRTYTSTADFEEGDQSSVSTADPDQLSNLVVLASFDAVWVANSSKGTVVKIDPETARVVGEFKTKPDSDPASPYPSRVAVDSKGNAWIANFSHDSVIKIGLPENGDWVDRDGNGEVDTSGSLGDLRAWDADGVDAAQDEAILLYLRPDLGGVKHLSIDSDDNVWVGGTNGDWQLFDGATGELLRSETPVGVGGLGGFITPEGKLYSAGRNFLIWQTDTAVVPELEGTVVRENTWASAVDSQGNLWVTKDGASTVIQYSPDGELIGEFFHGAPWAMGIAIDDNDHVWVAHSHCGHSVGHLLPDGTLLGVVEVTNHGPVEVSLDRKGRVWVVSSTGVVERINPLGGPLGSDGITPVGEVDIKTGNLGGALWTYGRFVGSSYGLTSPDGLWTVLYDGVLQGTTWGPLVWDALLSNDGTVTVQVASSEDGVNFGPYEAVEFAAGAPTVVGRFLKVRMRLISATTGEFTVLRDLTVGTEGYEQPVVPEYWNVTAGDDINGNWPDVIELKGAFVHSPHPFATAPTYQWSVVSGPGTVDFDDATALRPKAQFSGVGTYELRLTAELDGVVKMADLQVSLQPYNRAPYANAGYVVFRADVPSELWLWGEVRDDGLPVGNPVTSEWTQLFGPGTVSFQDPAAPSTKASFSEPGVYVLQLTATDGELTSADVTTVWLGYACIPVAPDGLVAWWQASGNGDDHIGGNQAFTERGTDYTQGKLGGAFRFDGVNDRVRIFGSPSLDAGAGDGFAIELWVNPGTSRVATILEYAGEGSRGFGLRQNGTHLEADFRDSAGGSHVLTVNSVLPTGSWTYVAATYDRASGEARLYVNGTLRVTQTIGSFVLRTDLDFNLGGQPNTVESYDGLLDEISVYDRAIYGDAIHAIYAHPAGKRPPVANVAPIVDAGYTQFNQKANTPVALNGSVFDDGQPVDGVLTTKWRKLSGPGGVSFADDTAPVTTASFTEGGIYLLELEADDGGFCAQDVVEVRVDALYQVEPDGSYAAWWPLNQDDFDVINGLKLERFNGLDFTGDGKVARGLQFDGSNDFGRVAASPYHDLGASAAGFTVEFWVKPDQNRDGTILSWGAFNGAPGVAIYQNSAGREIEINLRERTSGTDAYFRTEATAMTAGQWTHYAMTLDRSAGEVRLYVNGVLNRLFTGVNDREVRTQYGLTLGRQAWDSNSPWDGTLDEPTLYSRPLSYAEVNAVYRSGVIGKATPDGNAPPSIDAGPDQVISGTAVAASLQGQVTDDGNPVGVGLSVAWSVLDGPGTVMFSDQYAAANTVTFSDPGIYVLRLGANDGLNQGIGDTVVVSVGVDNGVEPQQAPTLTAWWPGDGHPREVVNGDHDVELINGAGYGPGRVSEGFVFDGSNDYGVVPAHADLDPGASAEGFTIEFWTKPDQNRDGTILSWGVFNGVPGLTVYQYAGGREIEINLRERTSGADAYFRTQATAMTAGQWTHYAATLDRTAGEVRLYVNGVLNRLFTGVGNRSVRTQYGLTLGRQAWDTGQPWDGTLDEPTIYVRPLAYAEIQAIYAAGSDGKTPPDDNLPPVVSAGPDQVLAGVAETGVLSGSVIDDDKPFGAPTVEWTQVDGPTGGVASFGDPGAGSTTVNFDQPGIYLLQLSGHDGYTQPVTDQVRVSVGAINAVEPAADITAWWPGDGHPREVVNGDHDVELINGAGYGPGRVSEGFVFDGSNDYGVVPAHADLDPGASAEGFTIEFWTKPDQNRDGTILSWGVFNGVPGVAIYQYSGGREIEINLRERTSGADAYFRTQATAMTGGQWTHYAATLDRAAGEVRLYVNGVLNRLFTGVGNRSVRTQYGLTLGRQAWDTNGSWDGTLDEPTIYVRPLAYAEIQAIYAAGSDGKTPPDQNAVPTILLSEPVASAMVVVNTPLVLSAIAHDTDGTVAQVEFFDGTAKIGESVSPSTPPDIFAATTVFNTLGRHELLAKVTDDQGGVARSTPVAIFVVPVLPEITLTAPALGATFAVGEPITFSANATYSEGALAKVEFYDGSTKLGETAIAVAGSTYVFELTQGLTAGLHRISARAVAAEGAIAVSTVSNIYVELVAPAIELVQPTDGTTVVAGAPVAFVADATIATGSIALVEFFDGITKLGEVSVPDEPAGSVFTLLASGGLSSGSHVVTAVATSSAGAVTTSAPITVTAEDYTADPTADIFSPVDGAQITAPVTITGVIGHASLVEWTLEYRSKRTGASSLWHVLATGSNVVGTPAQGPLPAVADEIGTFDPTLLPNGFYDLRIRLVTTDQTILGIPVTVLVDGRLKVGAIDSTIVDVEVPAPGIPLRIERTYSSIDPGVGDFGRGTALGASTVRVETSKKLGQDWFGYLVAGPLGIPLYRIEPSPPEDATGVPPVPRVVAITLPDHTVMRFSARLHPNSQIAPISSASIMFDPMPGTVGELVALDENLEIIDELLPSGVTESVDLLDPFTGDSVDPAAYHLTALDGSIYIIDADGSLRYQEEPNGNSVTYTADAIIHSNGTQLTLVRDAEGRISQVVDPAGETVDYTYDSDGRLVSVTDREGNATTMAYAGQTSLLTSIQEPAAVNPSYNVFDALGRFTRRVDALANPTQMTHDVPNRTTVVTDALGHATTYVYDNVGNVISSTNALGETSTYAYTDARFPLKSTSVTNPLGETTSTLYNAQGLPGTITNPLGYATTYTYDSSGRLLTETDALGRAIVNTYDAAGNLLTTTDRVGGVTSYTYDTSGNVLTETDAEGNLNAFTWNALGLPLTETEYDGTDTVLVERAFTYDGNGNLLTDSIQQTDIDGNTVPRVTTHTYDRVGRRLTTTQPEGRLTEFRYDTSGHIVAVVQWSSQADFDAQLDPLTTSHTYNDRGERIRTDYPDGSFETNTYDVLGRVVSRVDAGGFVFSAEFDGAGRLVSETLPDGAVLARAYDAVGRLLSETDGEDRTTSTTYDAAGQALVVTYPDGTVTEMAYDEVGDVVERTPRVFYESEFVAIENFARALASADALPATSLVAATSATPGSTPSIAAEEMADRKFSFSYDANHRLTGVTHPSGDSATIDYDFLGRPVEVINEIGAKWVFGYEGGSAMRRTLVNGPHDYIEAAEYDEYGNIVRMTDGRGRVVESIYDVARPKQVTFRDLDGPTFSSVVNDYDSDGRLISQSDRRGYVTTYDYTQEGRSDRTIIRDAYTSSEEYDAKGNLTKTTDARGFETRYEYDGFNRRITTIHPDGVIERITYDKASAIASTSIEAPDQTKLTTSYAHDDNGRLTQITFPDGTSQSFTFDADGRIKTRQDERGHVTEYVYVDSDHSVTVKDAAQNVMQFKFDAVGNLLEQTDARGRVTAYDYDQLGRRTRMTEAKGTGLQRVTEYGYDLNGNVTSVIEGIGTALARTTTFTYDSDNRVLETIYPDGTTMRTDRDPDGNVLLATDELGHRTESRYDAFGRVTQIIDALGNSTLWSYPDFGGRSVRTDPLSRTYTEHFDNRGRLVQRAFDGTTWTETLSYDKLGRLESRTDRSGRITTFEYDPRDRITKITNPDGGFEVREYDPAGNLSDVTDPRSQVVRYTYDQLNRLTEENREGNGAPDRVTSYTYDPVGNLETLTRPGGQVVVQSHDSLNRIQSMSTVLNGDGQTYALVFTRDVLDRLTAVNDGRGSRQWTYDLRDRVLTETDPLGGIGESEYDAAGNLIEFTDVRGNISAHDYDDINRPVTSEFPGGTTLIRHYDAFGHLTATEMSGAGTAADSSPDQVTVYDYDGLDRVTTTTLQDGYPTGTASNVTSVEFDGEGRPLLATDEAGYETSFDYSSGGYLQTMTLPDGAQRAWTYDLGGNPLTEGNELDQTTTRTFNAFNEVTAVTDPLDHSTSFEYDVEGRLVKIIDPLALETSHNYDLGGRRVGTTLPDNTTLGYTYDPYGNLLARIDQQGRESAFTYDALNRLTSARRPINARLAGVQRQATASYSYDAAGNVQTITDPLGGGTTFTYDAGNRLSATYLPASATAHETRAYDYAGRIVERTDGNGSTTRHAYDYLGRLTSTQPDTSFGATSISYGYNSRGLRTSMNDRFGTTNYAYDNRGRLISKVTPYAGSLSYGYDAADRLTSLVGSSSGSIDASFAYDAAGRLTVADDTRFGSMAYSYDEGDRMTASVMPTGLATRYGYDGMNRVLSMDTYTDTSESNLVQSYTYTRTLTGQIASELSSNGRSAIYSYDESDRLLAETIAGDPLGEDGIFEYELDDLGNRVSRTSNVPGVGAQSFTYNENQAVDGYTYDDHGNPIGGAIERSLADSYDFRHALTGRGTDVAYLDDGDGQRIGRRVWNPIAQAWDTTFYLNDDLPSTVNSLGLSQTVEERGSSGLTRGYAHSLQRFATLEQRAVSAAGGEFSVGLAADGTVWTWGNNASGQLGDGSTASRAAPAPVPGLSNMVRAVAGGAYVTALRADGALFWWGEIGGNTSTAPVQLAGVPELESIAAGDDFLLALATDGSVWTFGDNSRGQLGVGDLATHPVPVEVTGVSGSVIEVATGAHHAMVLRSDGTVQAWGDNASGQLGDATFTEANASTPRDVVGLTSVVELSGGLAHTVALDLAGAVYTWGDNANGQLGDGTTTARAVVQPVDVGGPAVSVAAGGWHSLVALADGSVKAWGWQGEGEVTGLVSAMQALDPTSVPGLSSVARVAAGARHSLAVGGDGQWYGWGDNASGQLGVTGTVGGEGVVALPDSGLVDILGGHTSATSPRLNLVTRFHGFDALGSVRFGTDANGSIASRYDYDAYGTLLSAAGESFSYTDAYLYRGERYDALTGLYHLRARDYDPALGRFHQIDEFTGFLDNPLSLNRYNYAESNPVGNYDPSGRFAVTSLVSAVYALHLKDQFLAELASAGPHQTFDPAQVLSEYSQTDHLVAASPTIRLKERELWVRSSRGGMLGTWVKDFATASSLGASSPEGALQAKAVSQGERTFGGDPSIPFVYQNGARFRQGWALHQVEQAWGAVQGSRFHLTLGPRIPNAEASTYARNARWSDAIYHDALLQSALRSATVEAGRGVRAHFTRTVNGRRYDGVGVNLTASSISNVNAAAGGGPINWQSSVAAGGESQFIPGIARGISGEDSVMPEFLQALAASQNTRAYQFAANWAQGVGVGAAVAHGAGQFVAGFVSTPYNVVFHNDEVTTGLAEQWIRDGEMAKSLGQSEALAHVNRFNPLAQIYGSLVGKDFVTGDRLSINQRTQEFLGGVTSLAALPSAAAGVINAGRTAIHQAAQVGRAGVQMARAGARGFARSYASSPARHAIGSNLAPQLDAIYDGLKGAVREIRAAERTATELRSLSGTATGSGRELSGRWLRGSSGNAGHVPSEIADRLRGRSFENFRDFREAFWKAASDVPELSGQFSRANQVRMAKGLAPRVASSQQVGKLRSYVLHHQTPIQHGGGVFDLDNIRVVTPRYHAEILNPSFHY